MKRSITLVAASAMAALLLTPHIAYPGIPIPAASENGSVPTLAPVVKRIAPSVVSITIRAPVSSASRSGMPDPMDDPLLRSLLGAPVVPPQKQTFTAGSGVIIDAVKGLIVTNYHVIEDADQITVTLLDGRSLNGNLAGVDPDTDVALIKVNPANLTSIPLGDSDRLQVGDFVLAIGNPFGIGQTVTSGIVSGLKRNHMGLEGYEDFIQTDASINPGNSGGALVNLRGELVGINAAIVDVKGGNAGIGFAIPINMVRAIAGQLEKYGAVARGELGFTLATLLPSEAAKRKLPAATSGVLITKIDPHSAAERAGLKAGDVVTSVGAATVKEVSDLRNTLALVRVGDPVNLTIFRNGQSLAVRAVMDEPVWKALDGNQIGELLDGAVFTNTPAGAAEKGVQVATVRASSNAWASGLREGDLITAVNNKRIIGLDQFTAEAGRVADAMSLDVVREGEKLLLTIKLQQSPPKSKG
jgi:Do/DeqQ family serine protease